MKKVFNIGINDYKDKVFINNKKIKSYQTWQSMLMRCYDKKYQQRQPTYVGCTVCKEWLSFSKFKEWFDKNYPYELAKELDIVFELDKDLIIKNNKIYSPDTCVFLPQKVNVFISNKKNKNTSGYVGVSWKKNNNKWQVRIRDFINEKEIYLGLFTNIDDARDAYIKARELEVKKAKEYLRELGYKKEIVDSIL